MMASVEYVVWKIKLLVKLAFSRALLMSAPKEAPMSASSSAPALGVAPGAGRRSPAIKAGSPPPPADDLAAPFDSVAGSAGGAGGIFLYFS